MTDFKMFLLILLGAISVSACGVRGAPQPPLVPPELGRGQPTYKKAAEDMAFPTLPPVPGEQRRDESSQDEE